jgi:hypothetical protein
MIVGLIGEGQEIHLGEEAGLIQWNQAIASSEAQWHVHCPTKVANYSLLPIRCILSMHWT